MDSRSSESTLLDRLVHWRRDLARRRRTAREFAMLESLNEYLLRDVGVERQPRRGRPD